MGTLDAVESVQETEEKQPAVVVRKRPRAPGILNLYLLVEDLAHAILELDATIDNPPGVHVPDGEKWTKVHNMAVDILDETRPVTKRVVRGR